MCICVNVYHYVYEYTLHVYAMSVDFMCTYVVGGYTHCVNNNGKSNN